MSIAAGILSPIDRFSAAAAAAAICDRAVVILECKPNPCSATFCGDILRCRWPDGTERRLLCKRGDRHPDNPANHHGGVPYEAMVYRNVLAPMGMCPLRYWGSHLDETTGQTLLIIDWLDGASHADSAEDPSPTMAGACEWIGRLHAATVSRVDEKDARFLVHFSREHYLRWTDRAADFAQQNWLEPVVARYPRMIEALLARPVAIIHGDYYPDNVLVHNGAPHPIDWGWAAVAPGEIDLASFTEGWADDVADACARKYVQSRWGDRGTDKDTGFDAGLLAARFYLLFRWLGHRRDWVGTRRWERRLERLRLLSQQTGLIV